MFGVNKDIKQHLKQLEAHLKNESPFLVDAVKGFRQLDKVALRMGLLRPDQSYANQIPWWPLISVLGTFSAGKSTFINHYLERDLQKTGNQAVDDKFSVICYAAEDESRVLPGVSLNSDPRFPFYQMADEIEKVAPDEGGRVNSYLQMKTCASEKLRGNIFIDSPGFDADEQRTSTLRITNYIIDLSDLVLIFFDARHPEPGAMHDTLKHLVSDNILHENAEKFIYILNQIDTSAREDNPEDIVASWQRALSAEGMTAGNFFTIYNQDAAVPIEDEHLRKRFERKRDKDLDAINERIQQLGVERLYRIIGALKKTATTIEHEQMPSLKQLLAQWVQGVIWRDLLLFFAVVTVFVGITAAAGYWDGLVFNPHWPAFAQSNITWLLEKPVGQISSISLLLLSAFGLHWRSRKWAARSVMKKFSATENNKDFSESLVNAFLKNTRLRHSIFRPEPVGWNRRSRKLLSRVIGDADQYIQRLNDRYTKPSGTKTNDDVLIPAEKPELTPPEDEAVENV